MNNNQRSRRGNQRITGDWEREPEVGEVLGRDLADAIHAVLSESGDTGGMAISRVCELLVRRGRLSGQPAALAPTVAAAVRGDGARSEATLGRRRFRLDDGWVTLTEWALPRDAVRAEQEALRSAERQQDSVRRAFVRTMGDLPMAGLAELLASWLNAEGVTELRAVRPPNARPGDLHLAGTYRLDVRQTPIAILLCRADIGREQVIDVRGAIHHYGGASMAWIVTLGSVRSGGREEAQIGGTAPCLLFDGLGLARAMERVRVGLFTHTVPLTMIDIDTIDALRGPGRKRPPREEEQRARQRHPAAEERQAPAAAPPQGDEGDAVEEAEISQITERNPGLSADRPSEDELYDIDLEESAEMAIDVLGDADLDDEDDEEMDELEDEADTAYEGARLDGDGDDDGGGDDDEDDEDGGEDDFRDETDEEREFGSISDVDDDGDQEEDLDDEDGEGDEPDDRNPEVSF